MCFISGKLEFLRIEVTNFHFLTKEDVQIFLDSVINLDGISNSTLEAMSLELAGLSLLFIESV